MTNLVISVYSLKKQQLVGLTKITEFNNFKRIHPDTIDIKKNIYFLKSSLVKSLNNQLY